MKIIFLRHGATPGNLEKRYIGITDEALSRRGIEELNEIFRSEEFQERVKPDTISKVFVSPMKRCRETAAVYFPEAEQVIVDDLKEMNFGIFEGKNYEEMKDYEPYNAWVRSRCEAPVPEGESKEIFMNRVVEGFHKAMEQVKDNETVAFAVHGGTIMGIFSRYGQPERLYYQWQPKNGHGLVSTWDGKQLTDIIEF